MSRLERRIQRFQRFSLFLLLAGIGLLGYALSRPDHVGVISAWMAIMAGVCGLAVERDCRTARGRWLLAALLLPGMFFMWFVFEFFTLRDLVLQQRAAFPLSLDAALGTALLWEQCRYLVAVFRVNRELSRRAQSDNRLLS
jgi:RsiW-degrading membrane proteinase PrsW (M82 family)